MAARKPGDEFSLLFGNPVPSTGDDGAFTGKLMKTSKAFTEYLVAQRAARLLTRIDPEHEFGAFNDENATRTGKVDILKLIPGVGRRVTPADDGTFTERQTDGRRHLDKCASVPGLLTAVANDDLAQIIEPTVGPSLEDVLQELTDMDYSKVEPEQQGPVALAHLRGARNLFAGLAAYHTHAHGVVLRGIHPGNIVRTSSVPFTYKFKGFELILTLAEAAQKAPGSGVYGYVPFLSFLHNDRMAVTPAKFAREVPTHVPRHMADPANVDNFAAITQVNAEEALARKPPVVPALVEPLHNADGQVSHRKWQLANMFADIYALAVVTLSALYSCLMLVKFDHKQITFDLSPQAVPAHKLRDWTANFVAFYPVHKAFGEFMHDAFMGRLWGAQLLQAYDKALAVAEETLLESVTYKGVVSPADPRLVPSGSAALGSALRGSAAPGSALRGSAALGSALRGSAAPGSALRGSAALGSALRGSAAPGSALRGSAALGPPVVRAANGAIVTPEMDFV